MAFIGHLIGVNNLPAYRDTPAKRQLAQLFWTYTKSDESVFEFVSQAIAQHFVNNPPDPNDAVAYQRYTALRDMAQALYNTLQPPP